MFWIIRRSRILWVIGVICYSLGDACLFLSNIDLDLCFLGCLVCSVEGITTLRKYALLLSDSSIIGVFCQDGSWVLKQRDGKVIEECRPQSVYFFFTLTIVSFRASNAQCVRKGNICMCLAQDSGSAEVVWQLRCALLKS